MDINKQIIDQRSRKIQEENPEWFQDCKSDENRKISKAFLLLGVASILEMDFSEAFSCITEGGNDAGIDALYVGDITDTDFSIILFQAKYVFKLDKDSNFPANSVLRVVNSIGTLFNPRKEIMMNDLLRPKIDEIRSLILDGYIPNIKVYFINNGLTWNQEGQQHIDNANFPRSQVSFEHINHDEIVKRLQSSKPIGETVTTYGKAIIEDFAFKRVLVGKISVNEIARLMNQHGDALLEKNIRKYLGVHKNRVNQNIRDTLLSPEKRENFYFFNNGITMLCSKFRHNRVGIDENWQLQVEDLQIINGGQTSKTIQDTISDNPNIDLSKVSVLLRLYEVSDQDQNSIDLTTDITIATNSQTPVDLRDLRANDSLQKKLAISIKELDYQYITKKSAVNSSSSKSIPSSVAAESILSIWKRKPHLAKYKRSELFGKYYEDIFGEVHAAQLITAVIIFRYCDSKRKNLKLPQKPKYLLYSNYFLAMLCGENLLTTCNIHLQDLTHKNFSSVIEQWNAQAGSIYEQSINSLENSLNAMFPDGWNNIDPRRLAATFRRGDLLSTLDNT